jgi:hypothetical protein
MRRGIKGMSRLMVWVMGVCLCLGVLTGCGSTETTEQKLANFKQAHGAIYDAWAASTKEDLKERLARGLTEPFLSEQVQQQLAVMQQRLVQNEKHVVSRIVWNKLELVEDGKDAFTVEADWTVEGFRDHGDIHEMKVSYQKKFHVIKKDGMWKIDKMM